MSTPEDPFAQGPLPGDVLGKRAGFELLRTLPGIDPVLAVLDGRTEGLPWVSWIISAWVAPGYDGAIELHGYTDPETITRPLAVTGSRANGGG